MNEDREWRLTDGGGWQAIDPAEELDRLVAESRALIAQNRSNLTLSHALCTRVRHSLSVRRLRRLRAVPPAVH